MDTEGRRCEIVGLIPLASSWPAWNFFCALYWVAAADVYIWKVPGWLRREANTSLLRATSQKLHVSHACLFWHSQGYEEKNVSPLSYWAEAGSRYRATILLQSRFQDDGLHAGVRVLASALLDRTELCWLWAIVATVSYRTASWAPLTWCREHHQFWQETCPLPSIPCTVVYLEIKQCGR